MIPVIRVDLDDNLTKRLDHRTAELKKSNADSTTARAAWNSAPTEKVGIRSHLAWMAPGIQRCMYCGDNLGTDIDHFEPIKESPARTFEWLNHLLACSHCNSNQKRDLFPRDAAGNTLLIDPAREDPGQHLRLILRTGKYRALTRKARKASGSSGSTVMTLPAVEQARSQLARQFCVMRTRFSARSATTGPSAVCARSSTNPTPACCTRCSERCRCPVPATSSVGMSSLRSPTQNYWPSCAR